MYVLCVLVFGCVKVCKCVDWYCYRKIYKLYICAWGGRCVFECVSVCVCVGACVSLFGCMEGCVCGHVHGYHTAANYLDINHQHETVANLRQFMTVYSLLQKSFQVPERLSFHSSCLMSSNNIYR